MRSNKIVHVVSCHAEGEVGDVIVGGVPTPPGKTIWEQSRHIAQDQKLRNFVLNEPRGGVFRHVNLLVPPVDAQAHTGWIIMEPEDTPPMSGSNSMCVSTVLVETGIVPMQEPETSLVLEAPGGLVRVKVQCHEGKAKKVTVHNIPSFVDQEQVKLEVDGIGTLKVDTAFGGDSFVLVSADQLGISVTPENARRLAEIGIRITQAANEQIGFNHPELPEWKHISFCQITEDTFQKQGITYGKNAVAIQPGKLDRSPCGTGCSARMALLHAQGKLAVDEPFIGLSPINSEFHCRIVRDTTIGSRKGIVPELSGRAWITGMHQHMLDPDDPWPEGYKLSDTWPKLV